MLWIKMAVEFQLGQVTQVILSVVLKVKLLSLAPQYIYVRVNNIMFTPYELIQMKQRQRRFQLYVNMTNVEPKISPPFPNSSKIYYSSLPSYVRSHCQTIEQLLSKQKITSCLTSADSPDKNASYYYRTSKSRRVKPKTHPIHPKVQLQNRSWNFEDNYVHISPKSSLQCVDQKNQKLRKFISRGSKRTKTAQQEILKTTHKSPENDKSKSLDAVVSKNTKSCVVQKQSAPAQSPNRWKTIHSSRDNSLDAKKLRVHKKWSPGMLNKNKNSTLGMFNKCDRLESSEFVKIFETVSENDTYIPRCTRAELLTNSREFTACLQDMGIMPEQSYQEDETLANFVKSCQKKRLPIDKFGSRALKYLKETKKGSNIKYPDSNYCRDSNRVSHIQFKDKKSHLQSSKKEDLIKGWEGNETELQNSNADILFPFTD